MKYYIYLLLLISIMLSISFSHAFANANSQDIYYYQDAHFSFKIPSGWEKIPDNVLAERFNQTTENMKIKVKNRPALAFNRIGVEPFNYPYFLIQVYKKPLSDAGIQDFIDSMQKTGNIVVKQEPLSTLFKGSLFEYPNYDKTRKIATMVSKLNVQWQGEHIEVNLLSAFFFYKDGFIIINFYCPTVLLLEFNPIITSIIETLSFDKGYEHTSPEPRSLSNNFFPQIIGVCVALSIVYYVSRKINKST